MAGFGIITDMKASFTAGKDTIRSEHPVAQGTSEILYLNVWRGDCVQEMKLAGIRRFAEIRGWKVSVVEESPKLPQRLPQLLIERKPLGCIVECSSSRRDFHPKMFGTVPTIWLDCENGFCAGRVPAVVHDGAATVRAALRELASNRPSGYAVVGYPYPRAWSRLREKTFRTLIAERGESCRQFLCRGESRSERSERLAAFMKKLPRRTAVFAVNDDTAQEVVEACWRTGQNIPRDITLLGVDNRESICTGNNIEISSVQIDFEQAGYDATYLLDALIDGRSLPHRRLTFGPMLTVRRESTRGFGRRESRLLPAIQRIRREACSGLTAKDVLYDITGSRRLAELRFREMMGHSILDEILNIRLEKACFLLSQTDTAIGAIAAQCGFGSNTALSSLFKRRFGVSLLAWRKEHRNSPQKPPIYRLSDKCQIV